MREYFVARRTDGPRDTVGAVAIDLQGRLASARTDGWIGGAMALLGVLVIAAQ